VREMCYLMHLGSVVQLTPKGEGELVEAQLPSRILQERESLSCKGHVCMSMGKWISHHEGRCSHE